MFELAAQFVFTSGQLMVAGICVLGGLAVGLAFYWAAGAVMGSSAAGLSAELGAESRMLAAKGRRASGAGGADGLLGVAAGLMPTFLPVARRLPFAGIRRDFAAQYTRAGRPGGLEDEELFAVALMLSVLFGCLLSVVGLLIAGPTGLLGGLLGVAMGPMLVSSSLASKVRERDKAIARTIPFVLDLLVLTMRAGASLQIAMQQVCDDYRGHPVGIEFKTTLVDIEMGSTSRQAFVNFAKRTPIPVIKFLVDEIVQSDELGRPIAQTLERLADQTRVRRVQDATATAGTAKVAVLAPGVLILFAGMIILLAPFGLKILYGGMNPSL